MIMLISLITIPAKNVKAQSIETMSAQSKVGSPQIKVGGDVQGIAVNEDTNKIYAYNPTNGSVSVIYSNSGGDVKHIRVGEYSTTFAQVDNPIAIDQSNNKIYVANAISNTVSVIDGDNDTVIGQVKVGENPYSVEVHSGTFPTKIYVLNSNDTVSVINSSNYMSHNIVVANDACIADISPTTIYIGQTLVNQSGAVAVIDATNDTVIGHINVGDSPCPILEADSLPDFESKVYVANTDSDTISVINGSSNTWIKDIPVAQEPRHMTSAGNGKIYVAGNDTISVINVIDDTNKQNISLGLQTGPILGDPYSNKIYIANPDSNSVSVINSSNHTAVLEKKEIQNITVGRYPGTLSINHKTHMIYVGNRNSHTVSVINGFSSKVTAGVTFNVQPSNSGTIWCGSQEYPTNVYIYVDNGTSCTGNPKNNFQFDHWVEALPSNPNSTIPADGTSGNLIVNRYGTFTANFDPTPPPIPPQYLAPLYGIVVTAIIGWSIPNVIAWSRARSQRSNLKECLSQIGKLDKSAMEEKIIKYYADGKISDAHRQLLKEKITEYYGNN